MCKEKINVLQYSVISSAHFFHCLPLYLHSFKMDHLKWVLPLYVIKIWIIRIILLHLCYLFCYNCFRIWLKGFIRLCFVLINNAYTIPTYVVWMLLLTPLRFLHPELFWRIEGFFFHWLLAMVSMWSWSAGYDSNTLFYTLFFS